MTTILILDDEEKIRIAFRREFPGYTVLDAATHADALRLMEESAPDMIVIDLSSSLQCADDCAFLDALLKIASIPIIGHTGRSDEEAGPFLACATQEGAKVVDWVRKPAGKDAMETAI